MGVRAKRWQLWLITMFVLTGIIGVFQLVEGPKSAGAVTMAGGVVNPAVGLPDRSVEATELPAWVPSASPSQTSVARPTTSRKPVVVTDPGASTRTTSQSAQVTTPSATAAPTTKTPAIGARSVATSAAATSTTPKVTTSAPTVTTTTAKPATTSAKATTTAPSSSTSVLKPTASATPTRTATAPRCYRWFIFWVCR